MIPNPDTLARIREQAKAYAGRSIKSENLVDYEAIVDLLVETYLAGADAGYTAALAERREK